MKKYVYLLYYGGELTSVHICKYEALARMFAEATFELPDYKNMREWSDIQYVNVFEDFLDQHGDEFKIIRANTEDNLATYSQEIDLTSPKEVTLENKIIAIRRGCWYRKS